MKNILDIGKIISTEGNRPLVMGASRRIWFVQEGKVDIFLVRALPGAPPVGPRKQLTQVEQGKIIFELPLLISQDEQCTPLLVGLPGTKLIELEEEVFLQHILKNKNKNLFFNNVLQWLSSLKLFMHDEERENVINLEARDLVEFLFGLHKRVVERAVEDWQKIRNKEKKEVWEKAKGQNTYLENSLVQLAGVLDKKYAAVPVAEPGGSLLYEACVVVGKFMGCEVILPPSLKGEQKSNDPLGDIVRASRMRLRRVALKGNWWKEDNGSFLAFQGQTKHPVALVPASPGEYSLYNPLDKSVVKVTTEIAENLAVEVYSFYRPFPSKIITFKDLMLFGLESTWKRDLLIILLMSLGGGLLGMLTPELTGRIFDSVIPQGEKNLLLQIIFFLLAVAMTTMLFELTRSFALQRIEGKMEGSIQAAVWDRLLALPVTFFKKFTAGELAMRAMGISQIRSVLSGMALNTIFAGIFSIFYLIQIFYYNKTLAAYALMFVAVGVLVALGAGLWQVRYEGRLVDVNNQISGLVLQLLNGVSKLRVAGAEQRAFSQWANQFSISRQLTFRKENIGNYLISFNSVFMILTSMGIYYVVVKVSGVELAAGKFIAFNAALTRFMSHMLSLSDIFIKINVISPLFNRAKPILETLPEYDETRSDPGELTGEIEVSHISFRYKEDGPLILNDVSCKVKNGEYVAVVGPSGSGKSTLLRILLGFEKAETGQVYYNGQDMENLDISSMRKQLGVVLQNGQLMSGDIFSNIVGSSIHLTIEDAWDAARAAGLSEDIEKMPMGMHTVVNEGATTLSGGQKQRLMIARAIVNRPKILYFDEATSALDNKTQAVVSGSLEKMKTTRVVIAHRLSTIINCDRIIVLDKGIVVEEGSYNDLMKQDGLFAQLAKRQLA
ncbi:MAG: NHLP bacteriocin export ABC transporter permease/ATPase subunit [Eubacteriales bacterium]